MSCGTTATKAERSGWSRLRLFYRNERSVPVSLPWAMCLFIMWEAQEGRDRFICCLLTAGAFTNELIGNYNTLTTLGIFISLWQHGLCEAGEALRAVASANPLELRREIFGSHWLLLPWLALLGGFALP